MRSPIEQAPKQASPLFAPLITAIPEARRFLIGSLCITLLAVIVAAATQTVLRVNYNSNGYDYFASYAPIARTLLQQGRLPEDGSAARYPIGYSLILLPDLAIAQAIHQPEETINFIQVCVFAGLITLLIIMLARRIWNGWGALLAGLLWVTYPLAIMFYRQPLSEQPYLIFVLSSLIALLDGLRSPRWWRFALAGICCGLAMLIRPAGIGLSTLYALATLIVLRISLIKRATLAALIVATSLIVVAPWEAWLLQTTHQFLPLSSGGPQSIRDGMTYGIRADKSSWRAGVTLPEDVRTVQQAFYQRVPWASTSQEMLAALLTTIREMPVAMLKHFLIKAARSWYATDTQQYELPLLICQLIYLGLALVGGVLLWKRSPAAHPVIALIALLTFYAWGMTILVLSIVRYMVPVMPLLLLLIPGIALARRTGIEPSATVPQREPLS